MNERPSEEAQVRSWVNPAIAVAVAPFAGYLMAYAREYGYAVYFDLPTQLISVDFVASLRLAFALLLFAFIVLNWGIRPASDHRPPAARFAGGWAHAYCVFRETHWEENASRRKKL